TLPISGTVTGTYQWNAIYNGDINNSTASDIGDTKERVVVSPASPTRSEERRVGKETRGTTSAVLKETDELEGGYHATGTITFTLVYNCSSGSRHTVSNRGWSSDVCPSDLTLPISGTVTGTYQWNATYNGDTNNSTASDIGDTKERVVVSPASPT